MCPDEMTSSYKVIKYIGGREAAKRSYFLNGSAIKGGLGLKRLALRRKKILGRFL